MNYRKKKRVKIVKSDVFDIKHSNFNSYMKKLTSTLSLFAAAFQLVRCA